MSDAREEILNRLKKAVYEVPEKPDFNNPVYHPVAEPLELTFKNNLEKVNGKVHLFEDESRLLESLQSFLSAFNTDQIYCGETDIRKKLEKLKVSTNNQFTNDIEVGVTSCEFMVAHTGSVMVSSMQEGGRKANVYPPIHIVLGKQDQIVDYLDKAFQRIQDRYKDQLPSQISLITGPSRTADIEKTLVMGAHGPKELHVYIA